MHLLILLGDKSMLSLSILLLHCICLEHFYKSGPEEIKQASGGKVSKDTGHLSPWLSTELSCTLNSARWHIGEGDGGCRLSQQEQFSGQTIWLLGISFLRVIKTRKKF